MPLFLRKARNVFISCSDESKGSLPSRLQPGAHFSSEPGGQVSRYRLRELTDVKPDCPMTKMNAVFGSSKT